MGRLIYDVDLSRYDRMVEIPGGAICFDCVSGEREGSAVFVGKFGDVLLVVMDVGFSAEGWGGPGEGGTLQELPGAEVQGRGRTLLRYPYV